LLFLVYRWFTGNLDWGLAFSCVVLSGLSLALMAFSLRGLLESYHNYASRVRVRVPLVIGLILSAVAMYHAGMGPDVVFVHSPGNFHLHINLFTIQPNADPWLYVPAAGELVGWLLVLVLYRANRRNFMRTNWGWIRNDTWLNPPMEAILELAPIGAFISSGSFGPPRVRNAEKHYVRPKMRNPTGHLEVPYTDEDGKHWLHSSWIGYGTVEHPMDEIIGKKLHVGEHYIIRAWKVPPTPEQIKRAPVVARQLLAENQAWKEREKARRERLIGLVPLKSVRARLLKKFGEPSGYYWWGLISGYQPEAAGTCVGQGIVMWDRLGLKVEPHWDGFFGSVIALVRSLGIRFRGRLKTIFDFLTQLATPRDPSKIAIDPNLRTLTLADKAKWEAAHPPAPVTIIS
jgi:hypothetical protein